MRAKFNPKSVMHRVHRSIVIGTLYLLLLLPFHHESRIVHAQVGCLNRNQEWSPDGNYLVFEATDFDTAHLYIMSADGEELRYLTEGSRPSWSSDGKWIAFERLVDSELYVYRIHADGTELQQIAAGWAAQWSPLIDVKIKWFWLLAFNLGMFTIGVVFYRRRLRFFPILFGICLLGILLPLLIARQQEAQTPFLMFRSDASGQFDVYILRNDTNRIEPLTQTVRAEILTRWSTGSTTIIFDTGNGIYQQHIMQQSSERISHATSVDGIFQHPGNFLVGYSSLNKIYLIQPNANAELLGEGYSAQWSPSGDTLLFIRNAELHRQSREVAEQLVNIDGFVQHANWSPDGEWIAFERSSRTHLGTVEIAENRTRYDYIDWSEIYRVRADGSDLEKLIRRDESHCSMSFGYLPVDETR